jgi:hypothetical protein
MHEVFGKLSVLAGQLQRPGEQLRVALHKEVLVALKRFDFMS